MTNRRLWSLRIAVGATIACGLLAGRGWTQELAATHVFDSWSQLVDAGDVDGLVALFSDDVVWSFPGPRGVVIGKEAVRFYTSEVFGDLKANGSSLKIEHERVSGSWASVVAAFTTTWTDDAGKKSTERSRYVCVLKQASNGKWGIWRFTFFPLSD